MASDEIIRDNLTGLSCRDSFFRLLSELTSSAVDGSRPFSLAIIDIDHFKSVNDGFGHRRGDEILREFGERIKEVSRENNFLFRYGGDEFVALLPGTDKKEAEVFTERLLKRCSDYPFKGDPPLSVTLSVGVSQFPLDGYSPREIFDAADRRVFIAKRKGRNCTVSEDDESGISSSGGSASRLLGREKEFAEFISFAREVADRGRGFFMVLGPDGSGKRRFLDAAAYLSLNNYRILMLKGSGEISIPYKALSGTLDCSSEPDLLKKALMDFVGSSVNMAVVLKEMHMIDSASLDLLADFSSSFNGWFAVAASTERPAVTTPVKFGGISVSVRLGAVSLEDCRAWFRSVHRWNPPEVFLEWFYSETSGLPGLFSQGVSHLERRGYITVSAAGLHIEDDYREFALENRVSFNSAAEINNLPVVSTPFVGREDELNRIRTLIENGKRLITLCGIPGSGCRRLAIQAAGQNDFSFPAGVCLVDCQQEPSSLPFSIASALSLPSGRNPEETIISFTGTSAMLFILTNANKLQAEFISQFLASCPNITVMVTARLPLDLPEESVVSVGGLSTEKPSPSEPSDAARVFLQAAERLGLTHGVTELRISQVEEICLLLGGTPLLIELAASWSGLMSPAAICRRIQANPSFLNTDGYISDKDSLSGIFRQSWEQLGEREKNAISRLTVFAGHFSVEEADEISDTDLETLMFLVDRSFLARDDMGIHIPSMTRDFILQEQNIKSQGLELAREMHCRHFAARASASAEMIASGHESARGMEDLRAVFDDICLAWKVAVEKRRFRYLRQMLEPVRIYCCIRGRFRTGYSMMEEALKGAGNGMPPGLHSVILASQAVLASGTDCAADIDRMINKALSLGSRFADRDRGFVLLMAGHIMMFRCDYSKSEEHLSRSEEIFRESGYQMEALNAALGQLKLLIQKGLFTQAKSEIEALRTSCRSLGFKRGEWQLRLYSGLLARAEGNFVKAREYCLSYLASIRSAGFLHSAAEAMSLMAVIETELGNYNQAEEYLASAAGYYRRTGSTRGKAEISLNTAFLKEKQGIEDAVLLHYSEALKLGEMLRDDSLIAMALAGLSFYHIRKKDAEKAAEFIYRAAETAIESAREPVMIRILMAFAEIDLLSGRAERAAETALALMQSPFAVSVNSESVKDLLQRAESVSGSEYLNEKPADETALADLLRKYIGKTEPVNSPVYRKGKLNDGPE